MEMTSRRTKISLKVGVGVAPTIFGSTVGYPSDSLASCSLNLAVNAEKALRIYEAL